MYAGCVTGPHDAVFSAAVVTGLVVPGGPPAHYSTGRLTRAQAETVNAWRARLRLNRPLPGQPPAGLAARMASGSDRPRASCSDAIAAAVADLLRQPPEPLELARYAYASMQAARHAARSREAGEAPLYPPVSWYLPQWLTVPAEQLRAAALAAVRRAQDEVDARPHPGTTRAAALACAGLPFTRQIPRGAIARMAIDRWAPRHPDDVAVAAAAYASVVHQQPHRARRDMRRLAR